MIPRVAFICPFNLDRLSGTPIRTKATIQAVKELCDIRVIAAGGDVAGLIRLEGIWESRMTRPPRFRWDRFSRATLRALHEYSPNIIHAVTPVAIAPAFLYRLLRPGVRLIFEMHGLSAYEMTSAHSLALILFRALEYVGLTFSDAIVAVSHSQVAVLSASRRIRTGRAYVVWGPVDTCAFPYIPPPPGPPFVVGYLGNDSFWQGLDTVLAAARLLEDRADIRFILGGFPSSDAQLPRGVTLAGPILRSRVADFLAKCHVLLSPRVGGTVSATQYPHKLSEYLAAGRPVIASNVSDQGRILGDAGCGLIVPPEDPAALAEAIRAIGRLSEAERITMGFRAREFAERELSLSRMAARLADLYLETLSKIGP